MTTGVNMMLLYVNPANSELIPALGWPRQCAVRCRRQSLLLYFLLAVLIFYCKGFVSCDGWQDGRDGR